MTDKALTPEETAEVQRLVAVATEAIREASKKYLGQKPDRQDREQTRAWLYDIILESMPHADDYPDMDEVWRKEAAKAGSYVLEPFAFGMPEGYDPKFYLHTLSDHALALLVERFQGDLDQMPFTLIRYEQLRRDGKLHEWGFKRTDEANAEVSIVPIEPAEFIVVRFESPLGEDDVI